MTAPRSPVPKESAQCFLMSSMQGFWVAEPADSLPSVAFSLAVSLVFTFSDFDTGLPWLSTDSAAPS